MRHLLPIFCLFIGVGSSFPSNAADDQSICKHFIDTMHSQTDAVFHDAHMSFTQKRSTLSRLFEEGIDTAWIAQYVAGSYWNTVNDYERGEFVKAYRAYLSDKYVGAMNEDDINSMWNFTLVDFIPSPPNGYQAHIEISQKTDDPISIDLRMEESPAGVCHVHDFILEGVSLLQSQREQIQSLAAKGGLKYVTQRLADLVHNSNESAAY
jgi:ABC-type transporter MlaC component